MRLCRPLLSPKVSDFILLILGLDRFRNVGNIKIFLGSNYFFRNLLKVNKASHNLNW